MRESGPSAHIARRHHARYPGETNRDCIDRLLGELRACEVDLDRHRAQRAAVLALHRQVWLPVAVKRGTPPRLESCCRACHHEDGGAAGWPCPTVAALGITE